MDSQRCLYSVSSTEGLYERRTILIELYDRLSLTVLVHVDTQALLETTGLALVTSSGVDDAPAVSLADVLHVATHRALEEATAAVAARHTVVLPGSAVAADQTASTST